MNQRQLNLAAEAVASVILPLSAHTKKRPTNEEHWVAAKDLANTYVQIASGLPNEAPEALARELVAHRQKHVDTYRLYISDARAAASVMSRAWSMCIARGSDPLGESGEVGATT